jgi:hypothetical protein
LVSVTLSVEGELTATLPKLKLVVLALSTNVVAVAVPVTGIERGEPGALLEIEMVPVSVPAAEGLNEALKVALLPAPMVDDEMLPTLKPVPETLIPETVTLAVPVFLSVTVCELEAPAVMLPNEMLDGEAATAPCAPVPDSAMVTLGALLLTVTLPDALPADVGSNATLSVAV